MSLLFDDLLTTGRERQGASATAREESWVGECTSSASRRADVALFHSFACALFLPEVEQAIDLSEQRKEEIDNHIAMKGKTSQKETNRRPQPVRLVVQTSACDGNPGHKENDDIVAKGHEAPTFEGCTFKEAGHDRDKN